MFFFVCPCFLVCSFSCSLIVCLVLFCFNYCFLSFSVYLFFPFCCLLYFSFSFSFLVFFLSFFSLFPFPFRFMLYFFCLPPVLFVLGCFWYFSPCVQLWGNLTTSFYAHVLLHLCTPCSLICFFFYMTCDVGRHMANYRATHIEATH